MPTRPENRLMQIRGESRGDIEAIRAVNDAAFGQPDEGRLVDTLRADGELIASLVADDDGDIVGHIAMSRLGLEAAGGPIPAAALAPMAVVPGRQNQGIGSALVRAGLDVCRHEGIEVVVVLGHENYYPRFGFSARLAERLDAPFSGPAFMAIELVSRALARDDIKVRYPRAFGLD